MHTVHRARVLFLSSPGFPLLPFPECVQYAELKPVPCTSYADAVALRDKEATPILLQVRVRGITSCGELHG